MNRLSCVVLIGFSGLTACGLVKGTSGRGDAGASEPADASTNAETSMDEQLTSTGAHVGPNLPNDEGDASVTGVGQTGSTFETRSSGELMPTATGQGGGSSSDAAPAATTSRGGSSFSPSPSAHSVDEETIGSEDRVPTSATDTLGSNTPIDVASTSTAVTSGTSSEVETEVTIPPGTECFDPTNGGGCPCYVVTDSSDARFAFCFVPQTRWSAKEECEAVGGGAHLVTILDQTRNDWLLEVARPVGEVYQWWIGLSDELAEGVFAWDDGAAYDAENAAWNANEPNDLGDEDCVEVGNGYWNDLGCEQEIGYICEL
jgi:Lectin C-type domain